MNNSEKLSLFRKETSNSPGLTDRPKGNDSKKLSLNFENINSFEQADYQVAALSWIRACATNKLTRGGEKKCCKSVIHSECFSCNKGDICKPGGPDKKYD